MKGNQMTNIDPTLKAIRAAYYEAGRIQTADHPPLPSWQSLPIELREAFIHAVGCAAR
jgi:hypothetical protein